ncbi:MAG TPA: cell division protein ZapE [Acidimicrobiales bacterium]
MPERLVDRVPKLTAADLASRFVPPPRFAEVRFSTYVPNAEHPSQAAARADLERFVASLGGGTSDASGDAGARRGGWFRRAGAGASRRPQRGPGRYLDGGFGVGKTHLLASAWHEAPAPRSFLTFEELTAFIGFVGMDAAVASFRGNTLLCIDEFELDDIANTRMAVSFLRGVVDGGTRVVATSNAVPDRLGEGRFNAEEFARELASIASHFEVVRIDGPDYRAAAHPPDLPLLEPGELEAFARGASAVTVDPLDDVVGHLRSLHPVHYGALLDGLDAIVVTGLAPIERQDEALLLVQLVDEIYDAGIGFAATGCAVGDLFPPSYRRGTYRKKYGRCESRLVAMLGEARGRVAG